MPEYDLLIFDWDGTLSNSVERIVACMRAAASSCDLEPQDEPAIKAIIGLAMPEAIAVLYPELDEACCVEQFRRSYAEHYLRLDNQPSPLFPGVTDSLGRFREAGYQLAVATGKGRSGLDRVLAAHGLTDFFDITRCADETASKPDPLMLNEILVRCGVDAGRALMIGDSVFDLQMAARAGIDAVAVGFGAQPLSVLAPHGPRLMVNHFEELSAWLMPSSLQEAVQDVG